jgi:histidinol-phosphatase (PHP family)
VLALIEPLLRTIRSRNLAVEISTAGWRKPVAEIYPEKKIILRAKDLGIPFTTASDAHSHVQLGENYTRLGALLDECGIGEVAVYENHRRAMVSLSRA